MQRTTHDKICKGCGEEFTSRRLDAKYCSDNCRNHTRYHSTTNERALRHERNKITEPTNDILWGNREILKQYIGSELTVKEMKEAGFNVEYFTRRRRL